jgi:hypothetical protein
LRERPWDQVLLGVRERGNKDPCGDENTAGGAVKAAVYMRLKGHCVGSATRLSSTKYGGKPFILEIAQPYIRTSVNSASPASAGRAIFFSYKVTSSSSMHAVITGLWWNQGSE